jgi:hypothetical protein
VLLPELPEEVGGMTSHQIITILLKHGPMQMRELCEFVDPDNEYWGYDEEAGHSFHVPKKIIWRLLEMGVLVLRHDRTIGVVKKDAKLFLSGRMPL